MYNFILAGRIGHQACLLSICCQLPRPTSLAHLKIDVHGRLAMGRGEVQILSRDEAQQEGRARACRVAQGQVTLNGGVGIAQASGWNGLPSAAAGSARVSAILACSPQLPPHSLLITIKAAHLPTAWRAHTPPCPLPPGTRPPGSWGWPPHAGGTAQTWRSLLSQTHSLTSMTAGAGDRREGAAGHEWWSRAARAAQLRTSVVTMNTRHATLLLS